jgi:hypothetical protein
MQSPLHLYLRDLIEDNNDCTRYTLECDHAGGHEVCRYDHISASALNASIALIKDPPPFRESNRARVHQCVKIENCEPEENESGKVQLRCASSDRSLVSRGSANTLIHRRRRSGRQTRFRASPQARSQRRISRAFGDEDDSVSSLLSTTSQPISLSSLPISPSSLPTLLLSPPISPSSPRSVMDAFSSSCDTTDNVRRSKSVQALLKSGLSWKSLSDEDEALMKMPNISRS